MEVSRKPLLDYFTPFLTVLNYFRLTGIDIFEERSLFLKIIHCYFIMLPLHVVVAIGNWAFIVKAASSGVGLLDVVIDLSYGYGAIEGCLLYTHFLYSKKNIKTFILSLGKEWRDDGSLSPDLVAARRKKIKSLDRFNYVFFKGTSIFVHIYMLIPILSVIAKKFILQTQPVYIVPFRLVTPFDYENNFILYVMVYGVLYVITLSLTYLINGSLLLLTVCMNQLRIQFDLLQNELRDIFNSKDYFNMDEKIKRAVGRHSRLLNLTHELSSAFGAIFTIHLFFLSAVICFYCVTAMINGRLEDLKNLMGSVISVITIYHCCYNGQLLADSASDVGTAIYDSEWYSSSYEHKKIVLIIILRSQRSTYIQSTSYTHISLTTFIKIMNMAWSFISLITTIYEEK